MVSECKVRLMDWMLSTQIEGKYLRIMKNEMDGFDVLKLHCKRIFPAGVVFLSMLLLCFGCSNKAEVTPNTASKDYTELVVPGQIKYTFVKNAQEKWTWGPIYACRRGAVFIKQ